MKKSLRIDPIAFFVIACVAALLALIWGAGADQTSTWKADDWAAWSVWAWNVAIIAGLIWLTGTFFLYQERQAREKLRKSRLHIIADENARAAHFNVTGRELAPELHPPSICQR